METLENIETHQTFKRQFVGSVERGVERNAKVKKKLKLEEEDDVGICESRKKGEKASFENAKAQHLIIYVLLYERLVR